ARCGGRGAQLERPPILSLSDRYDIAGPFGGAVPAHGEDPFQLRGRRPSVEAHGGETVRDQRSGYDDGQLPWLQAVEDEDEPRGFSARKMLSALLVVLLATAVVGGPFFWMGPRNVEFSGPPELIRAEPGPYKLKPTNPGGLDVAGESET